MTKINLSELSEQVQYEKSAECASYLQKCTMAYLQNNFEFEDGLGISKLMFKAIAMFASQYLSTLKNNEKSVESFSDLVKEFNHFYVMQLKEQQDATSTPASH